MGLFTCLIMDVLPCSSHAIWSPLMIWPRLTLSERRSSMMTRTCAGMWVCFCVCTCLRLCHCVCLCVPLQR